MGRIHVTDSVVERLQFGTAGLRAEMGPGFNRMNPLTVLQTCNGIISYILSSSSTTTAKPCEGVIIGYDGRNWSKSMAHVAAACFSAFYLKVYLFDSLSPTPLTPYLIRKLKDKESLIGIRITASHNPKQDNGFKLYWTNGAQIIPPIDSDEKRAF